MNGAAANCVDRYLELTKTPRSKLGVVSTPCIDDHLLAPEDFVTVGALKNVAARCVLKALYLARLARVDLLYSVNVLAREVTKWNVACDKRLHRLISYINCTADHVMTSFIGDRVEDCDLLLFCDASFAGDLQDSKSTSGAILVLVGPNTFCPISWICKKQSSVSHSSTESEVVSLDTAVRVEGIPAIMLWELIKDVFSAPSHRVSKSGVISGKKSVRGTAMSVTPQASEWTDYIWREVEWANSHCVHPIDYVPPSVSSPLHNSVLTIMEDNEAVIKMTRKGRSPALRHVARTHRVNLDWLFERLNHDQSLAMRYVRTTQQLADILTKGSFSVPVWETLSL